MPGLKSFASPAPFLGVYYWCRTVKTKNEEALKSKNPHVQPKKVSGKSQSDTLKREMSIQDIFLHIPSLKSGNFKIYKSQRNCVKSIRTLGKTEGHPVKGVQVFKTSLTVPPRAANLTSIVRIYLGILVPVNSDLIVESL